MFKCKFYPNIFEVPKVGIRFFFLKLKLKSYEQSLIGLTKMYCLANNTVYINYTGIKIFFNVLLGIFFPTIIISL